MLFEATLNAFAAQAVALLPAQRQKQFSRSRGTVSAQHFIEQRQRSHAIYIVIPEKHDAFASIQRDELRRGRKKYSISSAEENPFRKSNRAMHSEAQSSLQEITPSFNSSRGAKIHRCCT